MIPIEAKSRYEPVIKVISTENKRTTIVRIAVATSESVFFIPHFARTAVAPAKKADIIADMIHIMYPLFTIKYADI